MGEVSIYFEIGVIALALVLLYILVSKLVFLVQQNYKKRAADKSRSARLQSEYDCRGSQYRNPKRNTRSQEILRGKTLDGGEKKESWIEIAPGTSPEEMPSISCVVDSASRSGATEGAHADAAQENVEFVVQVAAYADPDIVKALTVQLAAAKMPYYTEPFETAKSSVTRVRVGPFANRAAAEKALDTLKEKGLKPGRVFARR